jgi:GTP-binding protein HflX
LEETVHADLLLHVVNLGSACVEEEYAAVSAVLQELGIEEKPMITVLNKRDLLDNEFALARLERSFPESVAISALTGTGLEQLLRKITAMLTSRISRGRFLLPYKQGQNLSIFHNKGRVLQEEYQTDGILLEAELPRIWFERVKEFML